MQFCDTLQERSHVQHDRILPSNSAWMIFPDKLYKTSGILSAISSSSLSK